MTRRRFPLFAVLYVANGELPGLVDGEGLQVVQDLLSHMTSQRINLGQVVAAVDVCGKYLRDQYPWLGDMAPTAEQCKDKNRLLRWRYECEKARGDSLNVAVMPGDVFQFSTPEYCDV